MASGRRKRRVLVVLGTRPEAIKLAPLITRLRRNPAFHCTVCVTGQHRELLRPVLRLFGIVPDHELRVMRPGQTLNSLTSRILGGVDRVLSAEKPEVVIVQGDTTTTLTAALAAFHQHVPVAHVEAGMRTGAMDDPFPEEANRRLAGALATWHLAATASARDHLLREGVARSSIVVTGNTVVDALHELRAKVLASPRLRGWMQRRFPWLRPHDAAPRRLIVVTAHRRESFGAGIEGICVALRHLAERSDVDIVWPVHLNPQVRGPVRRLLHDRSRVRLIPPQDYLSFVYLLMHSFFILTDSGGVQEEAPSLGKPVLVLRNVTERREAIDAGAARLVGTGASSIRRAATALLEDPRAYGAMSAVRNPFGDGQASASIERNLLRWMN